jgi:NAD(P)-dependent dehydrogenase (short-subunit alcohol dehydrogenase family)
MRFQGKVLFATGGGSGLAEATAKRFVAEGGRAVVVDLDGGRAAAVAEELGGLGLACDVADEASVEAAVARAHAELGSVDCVFNAAGHADFGPIEDWTLERFNRMIGVHLGGTFLVTKHVVPLMRSAGGGAFVNVASVAAITAQPYNAPYGAAKAAITGLTRQLARELGPEIRVNCVAPGRIRTNMTIPLYTERGGGDFEKGAAEAAKLTIAGRLGEPEDIAAAACYLLSDEAGFVTGQTLVPDGGETIL